MVVYNPQLNNQQVRLTEDITVVTVERPDFLVVKVNIATITRMACKTSHAQQSIRMFIFSPDKPHFNVNFSKLLPSKL